MGCFKFYSTEEKYQDGGERGKKQCGTNKELRKEQRKEEEVGTAKKTETQKGKANKILLFSCNQSLFGGSATGS